MDPRRPAHLRIVFALCASLLVSGALFAGVEPADDCFEQIGARNVPECVSVAGVNVSCAASGAVRLWSDVFQPVESFFPDERDSTSWLGQTRPETRSNDEHFNWIEIVDDRAYVAYVSGFSIWNLNCNMELGGCPQLMTTREVFRGAWANADGAGGEVYLLTHSLHVLKASNGRKYMAVNGNSGRIGLSLWDVTSDTNPQQLYQDIGQDGFFVKLAEINGRVYAFYAILEGTGGSGGIRVYDVTAAENISGGACVEDTSNGPIQCSGVFRGGMGQYEDTRTVDVIQKNGRTFLATGANDASDGFELMEVINPATATASSRWETSNFTGRARGVDLFELDNKIYLGINVHDEIRIYDVNNCLLNGSGCPNVNSPLWSDFVGSSTSEVPVVYTESVSGNNVTPFLYIGTAERCLRGTRREGLYDISSLSTNPNAIYEVTEGVVQGGETYVDPHHNGLVDYWGNYYARNSNGINNFGPRTGQFYGEYFLRTATLQFDKHKFLPNATGGNPAVNVISPGTFYFTQPAVVSASASNCATGSWSWSNDAGCSGQVVTETPTLSTYQLTCDHPCANPPCSDWNVQVTAETCGTDDSASVTFRDGRAYIQDIDLPPSIPPNEYPVCSILEIGATVGGEPTTRSYLWELLDGNGNPVNDPDGGGPLQATSPTWILDTTGLAAEPPGPEIFLDGFESGGITLWSTSGGTGTGLFTAPQRKRLVGEPITGEGSDYQVRLTLANQVVGTAYQDVDSTTFRLLPLGQLGAPSISSVELANGFWRFTETSENATQWRWEFYLQGQLQDAINWPGQQIIEYTFPEAGTWTVRVYNGQCDTQSTAFDETTVVVDQLEPPATIDLFQSLSCGGQPCIAGVCVCQPGDTAEFNVTLEAGSSDPDSFEIDWTCTDADGFQVEQTVNNPTPNGTGGYSLSHVYNSSCAGSDHFPQIRAKTNGVPSDPVSASPGIRVFD